MAGNRESKIECEQAALAEALDILGVIAKARDLATHGIHEAKEHYWRTVSEQAKAPTAAMLEKKVHDLFDRADGLRKALASARSSGYMMMRLLKRPADRFKQRDLLFRLDADLAQLVHIAKPIRQRPGRGNLWARARATPKQALVNECAYVCWRFRREIVSGRSDGPFYDFVAAVWEFATGQKADEPGIGLERYVKRIGPVVLRHRKYDEAIELARNDKSGRLFKALIARYPHAEQEFEEARVRLDF